MSGDAPATRAVRPRPALSTGYVAPRDDVERTLARFW